MKGKDGKHRAVMQESSAKGQKAFRESAYLAAKYDKKFDEPSDKPVCIMATFTFRRPKSHFGTGRNATVLREDAAPYPSTRSVGDLSKLLRCLEDSMTDAGVWNDDSQVVACSCHKVYSDRDSAIVVVKEIC